MNIKIDENFFDIKPLYEGETITEPAVYTIWTFDPSGDDYRLLYVGECSAGGVVIDETHKAYNDWQDCQISSLYLAVNPLPEDEYTREERRELKHFLIELYNPLCNI